MKKSTGRPPSATSAEAKRQRVMHLAEMLFMGNHHRMAEAIGVARTTVTKTLNGDRPPGDTILNALSRHPRVNREWLLRNEGEPLMPTSAGTLPVATALLPGAPNDYTHLLSGVRHSVAAALERDSRYWFRLGVHMPPSLGDVLSMLPGDTLLVESHEDHILRPDIYLQYLCALHVIEGDIGFYALGKLIKEDSSLQATIYHGSVPQDLGFTRAAMIRHGVRQAAAPVAGKRPGRAIKRVKPPKKGPTHTLAPETAKGESVPETAKAETVPETAKEELKVEVHGIVGVVLSLDRSVLLSA